ncbi:hypothetical protein ACU635_02670 [[Actinomadura] parvosata]|uniref:hypothetical protein n=1 Tax=[Actinomadura] parvosata TaxID=1955412 RepID=UPI00406CC10A
MEPELIDPHGLPRRLEELLHTPAELDASVQLIHRNLGWWAVLMMAAAAGCRPPGWAAWPLNMYLLAASVGGWTLTVVGGCALHIAAPSLVRP